MWTKKGLAFSKKTNIYGQLWISIMSNLHLWKFGKNPASLTPLASRNHSRLWRLERPDRRGKVTHTLTGGLFSLVRESRKRNALRNIHFLNYRTIFAQKLMNVKIQGSCFLEMDQKGQCSKGLPRHISWHEVLGRSVVGHLFTVWKRQCQLFLNCFPLLPIWNSDLPDLSLTSVDHIFRPYQLDMNSAQGVWVRLGKRCVKWCTWDDGNHVNTLCSKSRHKRINHTHAAATVAMEVSMKSFLLGGKLSTSGWATNQNTLEKHSAFCPRAVTHQTFP